MIVVKAKDAGLRDARRERQCRENRNTTYAKGHGGGNFAKHKLRNQMHSKRVFLLSRHL